MTHDHIDMEKALNDPKAMFGTPEGLLSAPGLDIETKLKILKRWRLDAEALSRAEYEGMEGDSHSLLRSAKLAIDRIEKVMRAR